MRLVLEPLIEYLPSEFLTVCFAAPFPAISKEVLVIARKGKPDAGLAGR